MSQFLVPSNYEAVMLLIDNLIIIKYMFTHHSGQAATDPISQIRGLRAAFVVAAGKSRHWFPHFVASNVNHSNCCVVNTEVCNWLLR